MTPAPTYRPEPDAPATRDLFAQVTVTVVDEWSLCERIKQLGGDVYYQGFATLRDRLRAVIQREQLQAVVCGRDPAGKVENLAQAFQRVMGEPLDPKTKRAKATTP
jgi:hypothetical protein